MLRCRIGKAGQTDWTPKTWNAVCDDDNILMKGKADTFFDLVGEECFLKHVSTHRLILY